MGDFFASHARPHACTPNTKNRSVTASSIPEGLIYPHPALPEGGFDPAVLLLDKPKGCTSFDVVRRVRRLTGVRKVGHAGTLDPMATGLLILLVGRGATKQMRAFMSLPKTYTGTLRLGETTPSFDAETEVEARRPWKHVTGAMLDEARRPLLGQITQRAPWYSAVHVEGERLYKKARRGERPARPPRQVRVDAFDLTEREGPDVHFRVECSKGTYIRSLAHDLGEAVGCGAHLVALRRTAIGPHRAAKAWPLAALEEAIS